MTDWEKDGELERMTEQARRVAIKKLSRAEVRRILAADFCHKTIQSIRATLHEFNWSEQDVQTEANAGTTATT